MVLPDHLDRGEKTLPFFTAPCKILFCELFLYLLLIAMLQEKASYEHS